MAYMKTWYYQITITWVSYSSAQIPPVGAYREMIGATINTMVTIKHKEEALLKTALSRHVILVLQFITYTKQYIYNLCLLFTHKKELSIF